jgi:putative transcriptional regulator
MENQDLIALGKRVKDLRTEKGLTQFELGARIGKNASSIGRLETGRVNPSFLYLKELANGLEVPLTTLLDY